MNKFAIKTKIIFDNNSICYLRTFSEKRFFVIADPFLISGGMISRITDEITPKDYEIFSDVVPDPPLEVIAKGIAKTKKFEPDCVIAVGGGSAIDTAKAIMYYGKMKGIKFVAIPTTSGTGSEVTSFSVITDKSKGVKYPLVSDHMLPDIAVLDTEFVKSVPPAIVADTGMDVLTHSVEAYVSTAANEFSDAFAEKSIRLVHSWLEKSYKDKTDLTAKDKMHKASLMAGLAFNSASLGLNHAIAHNIGARLHIPHGRINAILLPRVIEYNSGIYSYSSTDFNLCAEKYAEIARLMGANGGNTKILVRGLIKEFEKMMKNMSLPLTLSECKIKCTDEDVKAIAQMALKDSCINTNPQKATESDIIEIINKIR